MTMYHLCKQTRLYDGEPYSGPSSFNADSGVKEICEAPTMLEAKSLQEKLQSINPVGWNIWDSTTGKLMDGCDMFSDNPTPIFWKQRD